MDIKSIKLNKGREESILRRHPWIFSRAIQSSVEGIQDGDLVNVLDHRGNIVGVGHYQNSSLSVRLIAFGEAVINPEFWAHRLTEAAQYRLDIGIPKKGYTDAFRLIHGEGDQLPGLIVDIYGDVAVLQAHSIGMHKARHELVHALTSLKGIKIQSVYCKSKESLPSNYATDAGDEWLTGEPTNEIIIHEGGLKFFIDVVTGQKTGFFLDQRENRDLIRRYSNGVSLLNCFSYSGGFSLYALDGGATKVI